MALMKDEQPASDFPSAFDRKFRSGLRDMVTGKSRVPPADVAQRVADAGLRSVG